MQPMVVDDDGVVRFKANAIVLYLRDKINLNDLTQMDFSQDDWEQFMQLIGYSLVGFHELNMVSDETALAASLEAKKINGDFKGCRNHECPIHCGVEREE
jgi:hypothetical protein